jgi:alkaline phosphatase D
MTRSHLSRRDVLRLAGGAALVLGCGDNQTTRPAGGSHAAAILEPDHMSFLVSAWSTIARSFTVEVHDRDGLVRTVRVGVNAAQQALLTIDGLEANTEYSVALTSDDATALGPYRVRTAPAPDDPRPVRLAVSADLDPSSEFVSDLFDHVVTAAPDVFVAIGDFPYTDNGPPAMTVDVYRQRHAELRTAPHVRTLLQATGIHAIYDDHEFRNDWDGHFELVEADRFAAAMQVWDEFFPLPNAYADVRYRTFRWGANVECFMLDCRRFRSANADPDTAAKTMLGATQKAWLFAALAASTATFKLVFTSVPLDFGIGVDHWAGFTVERQEMFDAIAAMKISGVLFVSGDQHYFAAYRHAYGLREFQIGPLARGLGTVGRDAPGVLFRDVRYNFGLIDVDGDELTFSGVGPGGDVFYTETLTADQLAPA